MMIGENPFIETDINIYDQITALKDINQIVKFINPYTTIL